MSRARIALLVAAVLAVSWSAPLIRLGAEAPALAIALWRTAIATAVLSPIAWARHRDEIRSLNRRDILAMVAAGGFLAAHFATWIASVNLTTVASSVLLVSMTPVFVAAASAFMGEKLPVPGWVGVGLGVAGAGLVAGADLGEIATAARGNLLALIGAVTAAGYLLIGRRLRQHKSLLTYVSLVYGSCALILAVGVWATRTPMSGYQRTTWLAVLAIALVPQLIGHTTFNFLLEKVEAAKVTMAVLGEPLGSALIAAVLFAELPGPLALPGALVLLSGIALVVSGRPRLPEAAPTG